MLDLSTYKKVTVERTGKKAQEYALIKYFRRNTYFAVKTNGGERPRKVYLLHREKGDKWE